MNFDVRARTILYARHGSHVYGLNTPTSDEDFKGICIKPRDYYTGFLFNFEQQEHMASKSEGVDSVIYSIDKFARLAADCNPNIIEILFCDDNDILKIDEFGEELRSMRKLFLSRKAKHTFSGYAVSQVKRLKTHRGYLMNPPDHVPTREEFGLSEEHKLSSSDIGIVSKLYSNEAAMISAGLHSDIVATFSREMAYHAAKKRYDQFEEHKKSRNPARYALEEKFGMDTKHAMHCVRLMKMCKEILETGEVIVKRPDREELLGIRNGSMNYDDLIAYVSTLEAHCEIAEKSSMLPKEPDRVKLNAAIVSMTERYLRKHG